MNWAKILTRVGCARALAIWAMPSGGSDIFHKAPTLNL